MTYMSHMSLNVGKCMGLRPACHIYPRHCEEWLCQSVAIHSKPNDRAKLFTSLRGDAVGVDAAIHIQPNDRAKSPTSLRGDAVGIDAAIQLFNTLPKGQQIFVIASERQ